MIGNYYGQICPGPSKPTPGSSTIPSSTDNFDCVETPFEALRRLNDRASGGSTVTAPGCGIQTANATLLTSAVAAAKAADAVVLMLGLDGSIEGEAHDRHDVRLPAAQLELVRAVLALGKPVAVVLMNGGMVELDELAAAPLALVAAGYPGVYGGGAIARALLGVTNRWGKTTVTTYARGFAEDFNMLSFDMTAGKGRGYRYYTGTPLFPFGYGLSYTSFELQWDAPPPASAPAELAVRVRNTGARAGDEVVACYFAPAAGTLPAGLTANKLRRQLFDFGRVAVPPGGSTVFRVQLTPAALGVHDDAGDLKLYAGAYTIECSNGVAAPLATTVTVPDAPGMPRTLEKF